MNNEKLSRLIGRWKKMAAARSRETGAKESKRFYPSEEPPKPLTANVKKKKEGEKVGK